MQIGPDGWVYVLTINPREVWRYSEGNGTFAGVVVPDLTNPVAADPTQAMGMAFGPDNNLYLACVDYYGAATILRYDERTDAPLGVFVPSGSGGLKGATCIAFGPDGNLYVAGPEIPGILRFNGSTGAFIDAFVASYPSYNDTTPRGLAFGPTGTLYALAAPATEPGYWDPNRILHYDGATGALMGEFISPGDGLGVPESIAFGPDGNLYVGTRKPLIRFGPRFIYGAQILVYDGATGEFIRALDFPNRAGLTYPISMAFSAMPFSIPDIPPLFSRVPRWLWPLGLGFIAGIIASRITGPTD
jgi:hypothetical protein